MMIWLRMRTRPSSPKTSRISSQHLSFSGMKSTRSTLPLLVLNVVSRISVSPLYRLDTFAASSGAMVQQPFSGFPSSAAKHESESNRKAQPVDRAISPDQGSRLAVTDQGVVFNGKRHGRLPSGYHGSS